MKKIIILGALAIGLFLFVSYIGKKDDFLAVGNDFLVEAQDFFTSLVSQSPEHSDVLLVKTVTANDSARISFVNRSLEGDFSMPHIGRITSRFGMRRDPFGGARQRMHRGVDLGGSVGDTVRSVFDGVVQRTGYQRTGAGNFVVVRHGNGIETLYAHLHENLVQRNQRVQAGQAIGLLGNTGRSTAPHLHFEVRLRGAAFNPEDIIDFQNARLRDTTQRRPVQAEAEQISPRQEEEILPTPMITATSLIQTPPLPVQRVTEAQRQNFEEQTKAQREEFETQIRIQRESFETERRTQREDFDARARADRGSFEQRHVAEREDLDARRRAFQQETEARRRALRE